MKSERGFTVIELIFVIAIVGLLTSLAVFSTVKWIHEIKVRNFAEELFFDLEWARSLALTKGQEIKIVLNNKGYAIYIPAKSATATKKVSTPEGVSMNLDHIDNEIVFKRNGLPKGVNGHIEIMNFEESRYKIVINDISGRIYLEEIR